MATSTRPLPMAMISHESRCYIEIREGFTPIIVPTSSKLIVEAFVRQYLGPYIRYCARQTTMQSPPISPLMSNLGMAAPISPPPSLSDFSPLGSPALIPNHNVVASSPSLVSSELSYPSLVLGSPDQTLIGSPMMSHFGDTDISSNGTPGYGNLGLSSPPYTPETTEADVPQVDSTEASSVAQPSHTHDVRPKLETEESPSANPHKRSSSAESADSKQSGNDADDEFLSDDANNESGTAELRKPPNAFILYRKAINKKLREQQPNISVEAASTIIGKYWREETAEVKKEYKDKANAEREKYFIKKKQHQALLKRKRLEREEYVAPTQVRPAARIQRLGSPECHPIKQELICSESRELSSFAPEALAQNSQQSFASASYDYLPQANEHPAKFARSLTLGCERLLPTTLPLSNSGYIGSEAITQSMASPNVCGPDMAAINQHVSSSLEQLQTAFSQPMQSPPMTSMALDMASATSAALQSPTDLNIPEASTSEWNTRLTTEPADFTSIISSLFHKNN
ncbi:Transcription factor SOX-17 [Coemansia guatemalensis]|uniref:Transcription factor SOX-17 n=1 Tax=Coemansia guatemalensis TaxID=2761395 RepID=A0A9W8HU74_9FUNG|nr:Transcription factor SOX-17 [Coemansia guatemalensis]